MPLGQGIVEVLGAIPSRIEVSGHGPTVRITGGSFDDVLEYAREAYDDPVVLAYEERRRWWTRVTLTVTTDATAAATAPPLSALRSQAQERARARSTGTRLESRTEPSPREPEEGLGFSALEEIFAHQEQLRQERARIPHQRNRAG